MNDLFSEGARTGAVFSRCHQYRYRLWRTWQKDAPLINFLMLNPSTADDIRNDPTVERCQRRAVQLGYGGLIVTNLFAFRSTNPKALLRAPDPVGPDNDDAIKAAAEEANLVVCGWGNHGVIHGRGYVVLSMLWDLRIAPHCLRMTKLGQPEHPLYLPYSLQPTGIPCTVTSGLVD